MNNDNEANDANDNGDELYVGLPETERQELLRQRHEVQQEIQMLRQEGERLLLEQQRQLLLLEQQRLLQEQVEHIGCIADDRQTHSATRTCLTNTPRDAEPF